MALKFRSDAPSSSLASETSRAVMEDKLGNLEGIHSNSTSVRNIGIFHEEKNGAHRPMRVMLRKSPRNMEVLSRIGVANAPVESLKGTWKESKSMTFTWRLH